MGDTFFFLSPFWEGQRWGVKGAFGGVFWLMQSFTMTQPMGCLVSKAIIRYSEFRVPFLELSPVAIC